MTGHRWDAALCRLDGQAAIVTGAAAGIGRAVAVMLASAGAAVLAVDRDADGVARTSALITEDGGSATPFTGDVTDDNAVAGAIDEVFRRYGRLDVLVNNAGVYPPAPPLPDYDQATVDRTLEVNFKGTLRWLAAAARRMQPGGRIINISSIEALRPDGPGLTHYAASKAAVNALTRSAALDLGPLGIRVNAILPGMVRTEGTSAMPQASWDRMAERTPSRRAGAPEDIAAAAVFLASGASSFINGQGLVVDGGLTIVG